MLHSRCRFIGLSLLLICLSLALSAVLFKDRLYINLPVVFGGVIRAHLSTDHHFEI